ncbi:MAG: TonB family protein [Nitrospira sp.]|nr:TonB family protein [Nitrospira sp.]
MQCRNVQWSRIEGWGFSLILHGILLSAILPSFLHLSMPIHPEPFQWNVTLVELPQQATVVDPTSDTVSANELPQTGEVSERTRAPLMQDLSSPASGPTNEITETIQAPNNVGQKPAALAPTSSAPAREEASQPAPSITDPTPAIQDTLPVQQDATGHPESIAGTTPAVREPSAPTATSVGQEIQTPPAPSVTDVAMAPVPAQEPSQAPLSSAPPIESSRFSAPPMDYTWLQRAVSRRLEELKRSSRPSLDDSSPLKVLVKAVVSNTGELMEAEVLKSSGLNRIDQEAITLVQRAFPMPLDHTLDRQQIVMRIPITYSRD